MTRYRLLLSLTLLVQSLTISAEVVYYDRDVRSCVTTYCIDCHADDSTEGNVDIGAFLARRDLQQDTLYWDKLLRNICAAVMPPADSDKPSREEVARMASWIKSEVLQIDESNPVRGRRWSVGSTGTSIEIRSAI